MSTILKNKENKYSSLSDEDLQKSFKSIRDRSKEIKEEMTSLVLDEYFVMAEMHKRGMAPHKEETILDKIRGTK